MKRRHLFVDPSCVQQDRALLRGEDFHHVARVLRLREGAGLTIADGSGRVLCGEIRTVGKSQIEVALTGEISMQPPRPPRLVVIDGLARGARTELTLQKCTELGADEIMPAICERSVARPRDIESKSKRWQEIVRQAARQCERVRLPVMHPARPFGAALQQAGRHPGLHLIASLQQSRPLHELEDQLRAVPPQVTLAVGPEGGFSGAELRDAEAHGFTPVSLGPTILRAETAVIALLAIVAQLTGRLKDPPGSV